MTGFYYYDLQSNGEINYVMSTFLFRRQLEVRAISYFSVKKSNNLKEIRAIMRKIFFLNFDFANYLFRLGT